MDFFFARALRLRARFAIRTSLWLVTEGQIVPLVTPRSHRRIRVAGVLPGGCRRS